MSSDTYFADPALEEAIRGAESDTQEHARCTLADQELAYARVRYLERFGRPICEQGESSHQAQSHFVVEEGTLAHQLFGASSQDPVAPIQCTIAERVI